MGKLVVNLDRLMKTFKVSNEIGRICETGVRRLALSNEDKTMRDVFRGWLNEEGLEVRVDDFGNIYGRRKGLKDNLPPVMTGSHLDTQPYGGRYDGILGVLSALEMIKVLNENNIQTTRPIEIANFTNEDGRFNPPGSGSGGIVNSFTKEKIYEGKDENGYVFLEELKRIGYLGEISNRPKAIHSYVELHIEQGPVLESENVSIGIVEGDKGFEMLEFTVKGKTGHSIATPMKGRKDALLRAAEIMVEVERIACEIEGTVINIGDVRIEPKSTGHIPSEVKFTMLISHEKKSARNAVIKEIKDKATFIVNKSDMEFEIMSVLNSAYSLNYFSESIKSEIESVAHNFGYSSMRIISCGGHDANNILKIAPSGMIFIPCKNGISHSVEEYAEVEDIEKGANILLNTIYNLSQKESPIM